MSKISKITEGTVILGSIAVVLGAVIASIYMDMTFRQTPAAPGAATRYKLEDVLLDASVRHVESEAIIAGCSAAALRDDRLAPIQLNSRGAFCVQSEQTLVIKTYLGLSVCKAKDIECMFASGYVPVLIYTKTMPKTDEDAKSLQNQISADYDFWLKSKQEQ